MPKLAVRWRAGAALLAAAGAKIVPGGFGDADVVLTIRRPSGELLSSLKRGAILMGGLEPYGDKAGLDAIAGSGVTAFAMELMPRITRAQSMDILSSQANLAGYKAVIDAAFHFTRAFPMMMTAAGTVPAAKVFIMGVGVAGLQAIATARRLGAIVSATDVRKATEEQVKSLGAKFVYADIADAATSGGYAKELTAEDKAKQAALVAAHVKTQDVIITTALIPGRPAPVLITQEMVESMKPGSVIVDLAVERGGNCPLSRPDEVVVHNGASIVGTVNLAGRLAGNASPLTDGGAAVLLMSEERAKALGYTPLAYIRSYAYAAVDPGDLEMGRDRRGDLDCAGHGVLSGRGLSSGLLQAQSAALQVLPARLRPGRAAGGTVGREA